MLLLNNSGGGRRGGVDGLCLQAASTVTSGKMSFSGSEEEDLGWGVSGWGIWPPLCMRNGKNESVPTSALPTTAASASHRHALLLFSATVLQEPKAQQMLSK